MIGLDGGCRRSLGRRRPAHPAGRHAGSTRPKVPMRGSTPGDSRQMLPMAYRTSSSPSIGPPWQHQDGDGAICTQTAGRSGCCTSRSRRACRAGPSCVEKQIQGWSRATPISHGPRPARATAGLRQMTASADARWVSIRRLRRLLDRRVMRPLSIARTFHVKHPRSCSIEAPVVAWVSIRRLRRRVDRARPSPTACGARGWGWGTGRDRVDRVVRSARERESVSRETARRGGRHGILLVRRHPSRSRTRRSVRTPSRAREHRRPAHRADPRADGLEPEGRRRQDHDRGEHRREPGLRRRPRARHRPRPAGERLDRARCAAHRRHPERLRRADRRVPARRHRADEPRVAEPAVRAEHDPPRRRRDRARLAGRARAPPARPRSRSTSRASTSASTSCSSTARRRSGSSRSTPSPPRASCSSRSSASTTRSRASASSSARCG